ncbi:MAG: sugar-binding protein [Victivallaceae bacterium]|nr:sugar-binding protein [Victivallaceae bacterium]
MKSERMRFNRMVRKHPEEVSAARRAVALADLAENERDNQVARNWDLPAPEFCLPRLPRLPGIDGKIEDAAWGEALTWRGSFPCSGKRHYEDGSVWQLAWHGNDLYGSVFFPDSDMIFYRGRQGEPKTVKRIYQGDCLEVFIQPEEKSPYYVEYLLCPGNFAWGLEHVLLESGFRMTLNFHFQTDVAVAGRVCEKGYTLEFRIPLGDLTQRWRRRGLQEGDLFRMTLVRINLENPKEPKTTRSSFYPLLYAGHNLFGHARMTLGKPKNSD